VTDKDILVKVANHSRSDVWLVTSGTRVLEQPPGVSDILLGFDDAFAQASNNNEYPHFFFPTQKRLGAGEVREFQPLGGSAAVSFSSKRRMAQVRFCGIDRISRPIAL
jgi:hypothetical protein